MARSSLDCIFPESRFDPKAEAFQREKLSACAYCGTRLSAKPFRCGHCNLVKYCCPEHQRAAWFVGHKTSCGRPPPTPAKIATLPAGPLLTAAREYGGAGQDVATAYLTAIEHTIRDGRRPDWGPWYAACLDAVLALWKAHRSVWRLAEHCMSVIGRALLQSPEPCADAHPRLVAIVLDTLQAFPVEPTTALVAQPHAAHNLLVQISCCFALAALGSRASSPLSPANRVVDALVLALRRSVQESLGVLGDRHELAEWSCRALAAIASSGGEALVEARGGVAAAAAVLASMADPEAKAAARSLMGLCTSESNPLVSHLARTVAVRGAAAWGGQGAALASLPRAAEYPSYPQQSGRRSTAWVSEAPCSRSRGRDPLQLYPHRLGR